MWHLNFYSVIWLAGSGVAAAANIFGTRDSLVSDGVKQACGQLQSLYPYLTYSPNTTEYNFEIVNAWDKRSNKVPACVFRPTTSDEVAQALSTFHTHDAPFAVRGGGHIPFPGANNIDDGVLVALGGMDELEVADDEASIEVGPGNPWSDVYSALAPYGLYTVGGRLKTIGVPGLTLLGGVGYFINKYGFTMDNVLSYDVVLGNGTQVVANEESNRDLFWALKGGAGNYGIVTKFVLKTYKIPLVTSTVQIFDESAVPEFINAACDMVLSDDGSVGAGAVININYNMTTKQVTPQVFGLQETTESPPSRFANFTAIPALMRVHNVTAPVHFHSQFETPNQMFRISFGHHTIKPDAERLIYMYKAWKVAINAISDVPGLYPTFVMNLAPRTAAAVAKRNGVGNTFGLDDEESFIWWQLATSWERPEDDLRVTTWSRSLIERLHSLNRATGLSTEFLYAGDASEYQNPFLGYPRENLEKMRRIRDEYDPDLVFTKLSSGGFKLG